MELLKDVDEWSMSSYNKNFEDFEVQKYDCHQQRKETAFE